MPPARHGGRGWAPLRSPDEGALLWAYIARAAPDDGHWLLQSSQGVVLLAEGCVWRGAAGLGGGGGAAGPAAAGAVRGPARTAAAPCDAHACRLERPPPPPPLHGPPQAACDRARGGGERLAALRRARGRRGAHLGAGADATAPVGARGGRRAALRAAAPAA
jgi:hypothetical protein